MSDPLHRDMQSISLSVRPDRHSTFWNQFGGFQRALDNGKILPPAKHYIEETLSTKAISADTHIAVTSSFLKQWEFETPGIALNSMSRDCPVLIVGETMNLTNSFRGVSATVACLHDALVRTHRHGSPVDYAYLVLQTTGVSGKTFFEGTEAMLEKMESFGIDIDLRDVPFPTLPHSPNWHPSHDNMHRPKSLLLDATGLDALASIGRANIGNAQAQHGREISVAEGADLRRAIYCGVQGAVVVARVVEFFRGLHK